MTALGTFLADPAIKSRVLSHPTVAGLIGAQADTHAQRLVAERDRKADQESTQKRIERMMKEAEDEAKVHPDGFAAQWVKGMKRDRKDEALNEVKASVRTEFGETLGKAIAAIPEFKELAPEEVAWLANQMAGKPPDQVLAAYTAAVVDKLADKRAAKLHGTWKEKDLDAEARARVKEANARKVAAERGPSLRPPTAARGTAEPKYGTPDWDAWYESTHLGRRA